MLSWERLAEACKYYRDLGYKEVETPWMIGGEAYFATKPPAAGRDFATLDGFLVASGEQGFIELMLKGVDPGRAFTLTPCFRDEGYDDLHKIHFAKLELIDTQVDDRRFKRIIRDALGFFRKYVEAEISTLPDGTFDIVEYKTGIELGSYGIRSFQDFSWIYGTGLAEPRLSQALKLAQKI